MIEVDLPDTEAVPELGELLVLHRLGYQGHYVPRTMKGGWAHDRVAVPWAMSASPNS